MNIIDRPLAGLTRHPSNSRTHAAFQIAQIVASIAWFGFTSPIIIDEAGTVLAGHGRLAAAKRYFRRVLKIGGLPRHASKNTL